MKFVIFALLFLVCLKSFQYVLVYDHFLLVESYSRDVMRIVVTVVGQDKVGIIAKVTNILANNQVNVLNINQNIMDGFFNMVLIADMTDSKVGIKTLKEHLDKLSEEIGLEIRVQSEDIFTAMHQI